MYHILRAGSDSGVSETASTDAAQAPEARRQRAERSRSPAPAPIQIDTSMVAVSAGGFEDAEFTSPPTTPIIAADAPLCRSDKSEILEKFKALL